MLHQPGQGLQRRGSLATVNFLGFLGFSQEAMVQPVLALHVLHVGGDPVLVGILAVAFGLPTLALRPMLGAAIDVWRHDVIHRTSSSLLALGPLGLIAPVGPWTVFVRLAHGIGWAGYGVSTHALLGKRAPAHRLGRAAGRFYAMHALALLGGAPVGLLTYQAGGAIPTFVFASGLGVCAWLITLRTEYRVDSQKPSRLPALAFRDLLDPAGIAPMVVVCLYQAVTALFIVMVPVYVNEMGIAETEMVFYYPTFASSLLIGQILLGGVSDRLGRLPAVLIGCCFGCVGLIVAAIGGSIVGLSAGGSLVAVGGALITSSMGAHAMESARPGRLGAAIATYSLGYQMGTALGALGWGLVISIFGYPWPFPLGAVLLIVAAAFAQGTVARIRTHAHVG